MADAREILNPFIVKDTDLLKRDGFVSLIGGMHGGLSPHLVSRDQYAFGVNTTSRGGQLKTRPPLKRLSVYLPPGRFQGAQLYRRDNADRLIYCVDGAVYSYNLETGKTRKAGTFPTTDFARAYFCQVDRFMVVQNGIYISAQNWPIIIDGDYVRDNADIQVFQSETVGTDTAGWHYAGDLSTYQYIRVPIGTVMAYGQSRLFVAVPRFYDPGTTTGVAGWVTSTGRRTFVAGDIAQADNPGEQLAFTESNYLAEGGAFELPASMGSIYGMTFFRNSASGTGLGTLLVFGSDGVAAYGVNSPRDQWKDIDLAQVLFLENGTDAPNSVVNINNDVAYRSHDAIRFIRYTATDAAGSSGSLSNPGQSFEVLPILKDDTRIERALCSAAVVDNRLFVTAQGYTLDTGEIAYKAIVSLDVAVAGSLKPGDKTSLAYDGAWTGLNAMQVLAARIDYETKLFVFAKEGERNELWYLDDTGTAYLDGAASQTASVVTTRVYDFSTPVSTKEFKYTEMWLSNLKGTVNLRCYWRPDGYKLWNACLPYTIEAPVTLDGSLAQNKYRVRLPVPGEAAYDPISGRDVRMGTTFQFRVEWDGEATIDKTVFYALVQTEAVPDIGCETAVGVPLLEGSGGSVEDYYSYHIADQGDLAREYADQFGTLEADDISNMILLTRNPLLLWEYNTRGLDGFLTIVGPWNGVFPSGWPSGWTFEYPDFDEDDFEAEITDSVSSGGSQGGYTPSEFPAFPPLGPGQPMTFPGTAPAAAPSYLPWYVDLTPKPTPADKTPPAVTTEVPTTPPANWSSFVGGLSGGSALFDPGETQTFPVTISLLGGANPVPVRYGVIDFAPTTPASFAKFSFAFNGREDGSGAPITLPHRFALGGDTLIYTFFMRVTAAADAPPGARFDVTMQIDGSTGPIPT